ncbi:hypothetical protein PTD2_05265 [Pseudoalteromonas tunicata D2]|uniref:Uncharacterized protein n=1 Tax=Pseudoalteromonas tunicata D2 TaxID=87626 RepID=A4CDL1_9GAMM|nr:hypothetical protein PTD2_05265 [Pseudoalteromonas tunicata D2]
MQAHRTVAENNEEREADQLN